VEKIVLLLFLSINFWCVCIDAIAQDVEVSLTIDSYSPFISKYTKGQMQKKLTDTIISTCHSRFLELGKDFNFYVKADSLPKSKLPGYKLELLVTDSVGDTKKAKDAHWVIVRSKLFEEDVASDKVEWQHSSGITYTSLPGDIEDDAISSAILFTKIAAGISLQNALPLSLSERIPAKNVFEAKDVDKFESLKELIVIVDDQSIEASRKDDVQKLTILINNIFYSSQNGFAKRKEGDKLYFNYYLTTDFGGYSGKSVYDNQVELRFVVRCVGKDNYELRMEFDEKKYRFVDYFGIHIENKPIIITAETLQRMPSKINLAISELVDVFVRSNFD
jgi:hypothetical protein